MLAYLALLGCALAGYAGSPPYLVAACTIALASLSYAEHGSLYRRGRDRGHARAVDAITLKSLFNAFVASAVSFGGGWILRVT